ncbi:MAG: molybdopterin converting factor subunit 1 [Planctomycetes bacterium]|nr:molybdopterin converting factor subunit 1 [Planctomycetota bacterium]
MQCEVLLFAHLAEALAADRLTIELPAGATVADALAKVANDHEAIASVRSTLAVAVNERYCSPSRALSDGDTIALIPPVSGG